MSVPLKTDDRMTVAAFLAWALDLPGDARYELLDGVVHAMSPERLIHSRLKLNVCVQLREGIAAANLSCEAFADGMAVRVDEGTVFEPDAMVRCGPPLGDDEVILLDPIIVVEVTSPSSQRVDALIKLTRYFRNAAILHYVIVLAKERAVLHHRRDPEGKIETMSHDSGVIRLDPPGLVLDVDALFPAATPTP